MVCAIIGHFFRATSGCQFHLHNAPWLVLTTSGPFTCMVSSGHAPYELPARISLLLWQFIGGMAKVNPFLARHQRLLLSYLITLFMYTSCLSSVVHAWAPSFGSYNYDSCSYMYMHPLFGGNWSLCLRLHICCQADHRNFLDSEILNPQRKWTVAGDVKG